MSLLPTCNNGSANQSYFIENIGAAGGDIAAPCIKGTALGGVRVGNPAAGLILRGDTLSSNNNRIAGGQVSGGSLALGNSTTSFQNIVLTDGLTTINTSTALAGTSGLSIGGNLNFTNGSAGSSITGYYVAAQAVAGPAAIPNPAGLTAGLYAVILVPTTPAGVEAAEPAGVFYFTGTVWYGNAVSAAFNASPGVPNCVIQPASGSATLRVDGVGTPVGNLVYRKLLA